jgi:hypothetical protein
MNKWRLKNLIKNGSIKFEVGDEVKLFRKKNNGYPKLLDYDKSYIILNIINENLYIIESSIYKPNVINFDTIKINKQYLVPTQKLRDFKLKLLLDN